MRDAIRPYLEGHFGNPSSAHRHDSLAAEAVRSARGQLASLVGCEPEAIVFTASGSEADNLALQA